METNDGPTSYPSSESMPTEAAKQQATHVANQAQSEAQSVAQDAKYEAQSVMHDAEAGVRDVIDEARDVVHEEADKQTRSLSGSLRQLADDMTSMAHDGNSETAAADYVGRMGSSLGSIADRLDEGGIDGALDDLRGIARRNPGLFLAGAAFAGFSMARILRHADASSSDGQHSRGRTETLPSRGSRPGPAQGTGSPQEIDIRDEYQERPGEAPRLPGEVQEWARP